MKITVTQKRFERTTSGSVVAGIWISSGGIAFPAEDWDDFATVILSAFVEALTRLAATGQQETVHFMEGPFSVRIRRAHDATVRVMGFANGLDPAVPLDEHVQLQDIVADVVGASVQLLDWCRQRGWWGRDEMTLADATERLERVFQSKKQ